MGGEGSQQRQRGRPCSRGQQAASTRAGSAWQQWQQRQPAPFMSGRWAMARLACWVCLALGCWPSTRAESIIAALPKERRAAPWQSPLPAKAATRPAKKSNAILHMTQEACSVDDKDLFGRSTCNADEQKARLVHELLASSQDARSVESRLQASVVPPTIHQTTFSTPSHPTLLLLHHAKPTLL